MRGVIPSNFMDKIAIDVAWVAKIGEHAPIETAHGTFPAPRLAGGTGSPNGIRSAGQRVQPSGIRSARQPERASGSSSARPAHSPAKRLTSKTTVDTPDPDISREEPEDPGAVLRSCTENQPNTVLTVYHHSYRGAPIIGWSGTKRDGLRPMEPEQITGYGGSAFVCPACGQQNASGLLLCRHCFDI